MNMINARVRHERFGDGVIVSFDGESITISFSGVEKNFQYPETFETKMVALDPYVQAQINRDVEVKKLHQGKTPDRENRDGYISTPISSKSGHSANHWELQADVKSGNINIDDFKAWFATQKSVNGTPYPDNVIRSYISAMRNAPRRLTLDESTNSDIFACRTISELDALCHEFRSVPNYAEVNRTYWHGQFSSGLALYRRYLIHLYENGPYKINNQGAILASTSLVTKTIPQQLISSTTVVPNSLIEALSQQFASGIRFDKTALILLKSASGVEIDERIQAALKQRMFCRNDGIYFLLDTVVDAKTRKSIIESAESFLQEYGCFEIPELYKLYEDMVNPKCIANADDFESFYEQINNSGVRCVAAPQIGNRIARFNDGNVWGTFQEVSVKIVSAINNDFYGSVNEDDLHSKFSAFSTDLLSKIIKNCAADELVRVKINDSICYQTFDALGLPDNFSDVLSETLERLSIIGLEPNQDVLHTSLSLKLGVNFLSEFNLPDWDTFRRLIALFYKAGLRREWKRNIFGEVKG